MNILVVEDEVRLAQNIGKILELDGYNVSLAHDGVQAESCMFEGHFDLLVMDVMMPNQDGWETLTRLRESGNNVPVLMLTALSQIDDRIKGLDMGADDYLPKPFEMNELRARVRALLRRRESVIAQELSCDSLVLNRDTKQATRVGTHVDLSATEYRLLEFLMLNQDQVHSETDLLEQVWDQNYDGMSNVVAVYVRYVRNKIDKAFPDESPLIHTVRGLGYSLHD